MKPRVKVFILLATAFLAVFAYGIGRYGDVDNPPFTFSFSLGFLLGAVAVQGFWKILRKNDEG